MKLYQSKTGRSLALGYLIFIGAVLALGGGILIPFLAPISFLFMPSVEPQSYLIPGIILSAMVPYFFGYYLDHRSEKRINERLLRSKIGWYFVFVYLFLYFSSYILDETIFRNDFDGTLWGYSVREAFTFWLLIINSLFKESIQRDFRQSIEPLGFIFSLATVYFIGAGMEKLWRKRKQPPQTPPQSTNKENI